VDKIGDSLNLNQLAIQDLNNPLKKFSEAEEGSSQGSEKSGDLLKGFGEMLNKQISHINDLQSKANDAVQSYAVGGPVELHNVMLAVEKADMALQMAVQVRNKMLSAYQEISRMQV
jgi:flagellar hook-basal body complex protein FliE